MLSPKKIKFRKWHKGRRRALGVASRGQELDFGSFGLKSIERCWVDARQIEAARKTMTGHLKRKGKVWIRIFPDKPVTAKGEQSTMGGGKGAPEKFVVDIKPGQILFEIEGVDEAMAKEAMRLAGYKLPVKTKFVK